MRSDPLPQDRDVWRIAAPMILSNVSVPLLGMVDTGVTGHLDDAVYLGAVAIGATIFGFVYGGLNSCAWARQALPRRNTAQTMTTA